MKVLEPQVKKDGTHIREEIKGGHEKNMFGILLRAPPPFTLG